MIDGNENQSPRRGAGRALSFSRARAVPAGGGGAVAQGMLVGAARQVCMLVRGEAGATPRLTKDLGAPAAGDGMSRAALFWAAAMRWWVMEQRTDACARGAAGPMTGRGKAQTTKAAEAPRFGEPRPAERDICAGPGAGPELSSDAQSATPVRLVRAAQTVMRKARRRPPSGRPLEAPAKPPPSVRGGGGGGVRHRNAESMMAREHACFLGCRSAVRGRSIMRGRWRGGSWRRPPRAPIAPAACGWRVQGRACWRRAPGRGFCCQRRRADAGVP